VEHDSEAFLHICDTLAKFVFPKLTLELGHARDDELRVAFERQILKNEEV
jgi:hypothetical protein